MTYAELHAHSSYSFCDGASLPEELARTAAEHGYEALALTDHDNVCGAMELAQACKELDLRPIHGAELSIRDVGHLTVLVESAAGWHNLCRLLTEAHSETRPHPDRDPLPPSLPLDSLLERNEGLVCLSGCARDGALAGAWKRGEPRAAEPIARRLLGAFGSERLRVELQRPLWRRDRSRNRWLAGVADRLGVACVATGNVHSHDRRRAALQDALVAVRTHTTLEESESLRRGNTSSVLASPAAMAARFADHPAAVAEAGRLAERLRFDLTSELGYRYPGAEDDEADRTLAEICRGRLELRYAGTREGPEAERRLDEELRVIRKLGLSGFFLLHFDLLELAREVAAEVRGPESARNLLPPGRGRGSSVSSVVCYLTGLSHVDPGPRRALSRPVPQRRRRRDAGHRPRLPPRHPRAADPARARPLRARAGRARRPPSPATARAARSAISARSSACPPARSSGSPRSPTCTPAATRSSATSPRCSAPSAPAHRAGGGWPSSRARPGVCRATPPSTRAGWCSRPGR